MYKLCIVGLGNPDKKYNNTRHNIGKDWLIKLSEDYNITFTTKTKFEAEIGESHNGSILWIIPTNYVNNSGKTLSKIIKSTNLKPENFLIIHDELDLDVGSLRIKDSGGHGGHNGLKDIINKIGEPYIKSRSKELSSNSGLGLGTFLGKTLLERQNAKLSFKRNKDLGGALVIISWSPKNFINS